MTTNLIPAETVTILRSALLTELNNPAGQLEQASLAKDKERRPELFHTPLIEMNASCTMLGAIGWSEPTDPTTETSVRIDFDVYRRIAVNAMRVKLIVERDFLAEREDAGERDDLYEQAQRDIELIEAFLAQHDPSER